MGFIIGTLFGGMTGLYYAVTYRTFYYLPSIALTSGCSFGFFMGLGSILRSEMEMKCIEGEEGQEDKDFYMR